MAYNNGREQRRFRKEWEKLRRDYRAAGMQEEAIDEMKAFDREQLKGDRRFCTHEEPLSSKMADAGTKECELQISTRFGESLWVKTNISAPDRRYAWIDELDNEKLIKAVGSLKPSELGLLTRYAIEEYTVTEIARQMGMRHQTISEKIGRIKQKLKSF